MATPQVQTEQAKKGTPSEPKAAIERKEPSAAPVRREPSAARPLSLMRRLSEDMDRLFEEFFGSGLIGPERLGAFTDRAWPAIDVYQRDNKLVVQADVPGIDKDNIKVEVRDNQLFISGERKSESERSEQGYYRSERSYGSFSRTIALPEGAKQDTASARFNNGVLEVEVELSPQKKPQGRVIEVRETKSN